MFERRWLKPRSETSVCDAGRLHDVDAREAAEQLGDLRDAREADVLLGDDRRRVRRVERALGDLRRGDDRLLEDLFGLERPANAVGPAATLPAAPGRAPPAGPGRAARDGSPLRARRLPVPSTRGPRRGVCACCASSSIACCLRDARLEARDDLRDLVAILRVPLEVLLVVDDRVLEVAHVDVRARDVVEDVRVRKDVVRLLELLDAGVVAAIGDRGHSLLEVGAGLRALVGARDARRVEQHGAKQQPGGDLCIPALHQVFELPEQNDVVGRLEARTLTEGPAVSKNR